MSKCIRKYIFYIKFWKKNFFISTLFTWPGGQGRKIFFFDFHHSKISTIVKIWCWFRIYMSRSSVFWSDIHCLLVLLLLSIEHFLVDRFSFYNEKNNIHAYTWILKEKILSLFLSFVLVSRYEFDVDCYLIDIMFNSLLRGPTLVIRTYS